MPNTQAENETAYILALHTDSTHHEDMTKLRNQFFPPRLNKLGAHIALFRALPGSKLDEIVNDLASLASTTTTFPIKTTNVFRFSKGVAVNVDDGGKSRTIYNALSQEWSGFLSKQDQSYRPHYTAANMLDSDADVKKCLQAMQTEFGGSTGMVEGLALYRYHRGCWMDEKVFWLQKSNTGD